ncbi:serine/threonine-protein kinase [Bryobacter aggregatus]|uniref:serine/threonine-protein kinase n=1 Tax=Bryobacter aggregatus TaxID=360054 RepID=UPI00068EAB44|nr:serine/threonine-protein kinase [Bryobacter aggregatus]
MALQVGESVGHYQIVEEIGAGGNGRVLKVEHLITRRREAMKILINGRPTSQEYAHSFLREIRLQASLDHPNIAAVLNAFWLEDDLVMVMELIEGSSLQKLLSGRRLSLEQGLGIMRQVLHALSYAHSNGVVHRDVSTANIIVHETGRIKLTDFGLARGSSEMALTEAGGMVGSPNYISPEQVRGATAPDQRSDIYSTGVVLYELLTGTRPFAGDSAFLLMQAHVQQSPQPPIERNAVIPRFINDAILKALAKNPLDRFQSAEEFLAAIDGPSGTSDPVSHLDQMLDTPPLPPTAKPKRSLLRRIWTSPIMGALLGIGVVAAAVAPVLLYDFATGRPRFGPASRAAEVGKPKAAPKPPPGERGKPALKKAPSPRKTANR